MVEALPWTTSLMEYGNTGSDLASFDYSLCYLSSSPLHFSSRAYCVGIKSRLERNINQLSWSQNESAPVCLHLSGYSVNVMSLEPIGPIGRRTEIMKGVQEHTVLSTTKGGGMHGWRNQNKIHLFTSVLLFGFAEENDVIFCQFQMPPVTLHV